MPPRNQSPELVKYLNNNDGLMTSWCLNQWQLGDQQLQYKSNIAKEQFLMSMKPERRKMCEYRNNLQCHSVSDDRKIKATELPRDVIRPAQSVCKQERRRCRRRKVLSWVCALVFGPCWVFYQCAKTQPDVDDENDYKRQMSDDFFCPCYYEG